MENTRIYLIRYHYREKSYTEKVHQPAVPKVNAFFRIQTTAFKIAPCQHQPLYPSLFLFPCGGLRLKSAQTKMKKWEAHMIDRSTGHLQLSSSSSVVASNNDQK